MRDQIFPMLQWYYRPDGMENSFGSALDEAEKIMAALAEMKDTDQWLVGFHAEMPVGEFRKLLK